jgi:hypothetical protein
MRCSIGSSLAPPACAVASSRFTRLGEAAAEVAVGEMEYEGMEEEGGEGGCEMGRMEHIVSVVLGYMLCN